MYDDSLTGQLSFVLPTSSCPLPAEPSGNGTAKVNVWDGMHASVDTMLPLGQRFVPPSPATTSGRESQGKQHTTAWAVRGGIRDLAGEFERLRPSMAHHFPFELDTFQKEAVIHLEKVGFSCTCTRIINYGCLTLGSNYITPHFKSIRPSVGVHRPMPCSLYMRSSGTCVPGVWDQPPYLLMCVAGPQCVCGGTYERRQDSGCWVCTGAGSKALHACHLHLPHKDHLQSEVQGLQQWLWGEESTCLHLTNKTICRCSDFEVRSPLVYISPTRRSVAAKAAWGLRLSVLLLFIFS